MNVLTVSVAFSSSFFSLDGDYGNWDMCIKSGVPVGPQRSASWSLINKQRCHTCGEPRPLAARAEREENLEERRSSVSYGFMDSLMGENTELYFLYQEQNIRYFRYTEHNDHWTFLSLRLMYSTVLPSLFNYSGDDALKTNREPNT
ncbi:unnamed protein product [Boreogadus saida]